MATLRLPQVIWEAVHGHLFTRPGEHFAFLFASWSSSRGEPVFLAYDVHLVPEKQAGLGLGGMDVSLEVILSVVNTAVKTGSCLIEVHNHGGRLPRFSDLDERELGDFGRYVLDSLPGRPYAATVWGDETVYGECFLPDGRRVPLSSITVVGRTLRQVVSRNDDLAVPDVAFDRQLPWFTAAGQRQLERLRVAVVGCGGTGSQVIQNLAYIGCRNLVLIDPDHMENSNRNRLVTGALADADTPKVILGRQLARRVNPAVEVTVVDEPLQTLDALEALKGADVIFGCIDNDGARLILNELALAYQIPYFDVAVEIDASDGRVAQAGGRVAAVLPGGPCLCCMGEINSAEAAYFLSSPAQQADNRARGYVRGMGIPAPAVVSLDAVVAGVAVNEYAVLVSGLRPVNVFSEYDLLGVGRKVKSQWLVPTIVRHDPGCVQCARVGQGDKCDIMRYARAID